MQDESSMLVNHNLGELYLFGFCDLFRGSGSLGLMFALLGLSIPSAHDVNVALERWCISVRKESRNNVFIFE